MELTKSKRPKKGLYINMYYVQSMSFRNNRYSYENTYLSNPRKTYFSLRPLV